MRKPRDFDAELKALHDKQKIIKARKVTQLGELVLATGADGLDAEVLAGALLDAAERAERDDPNLSAWRTRGDAFFRQTRRRSSTANGGDPIAAAAAPPDQRQPAADPAAVAPR
jgi:hypothetical protein